MSGVEQNGGRGRAPQPLPLAPRALQPRLGPLYEPRPLVLRDPAEHGDEERADRAARVEPAFADRQHGDAEPVQLQHRHDRGRHAAVESVERPYRYGMDAASARVREHPIQHGPRLRGRLRFLVDDGSYPRAAIRVENVGAAAARSGPRSRPACASRVPRSAPDPRLVRAARTTWCGGPRDPERGRRVPPWR